MNTTQKATNVAVVNQQQIIILNKDGVDYVPIRPICDALGVDFSAQLQRIKRDPIFGSTVVTVTTVGADKKDREMVTLPHELIFGWLFTIDTNLVKEEVREAVIEYKRECNRALYFHFKSYMDYNEHRLAKIAEADMLLASYRLEFNQAKDKMKEAQHLKNEAWAYTFDDWVKENAQLKMDFPEADEEAETLASKGGVQ